MAKLKIRRNRNSNTKSESIGNGDAISVDANAADVGDTPTDVDGDVIQEFDPTVITGEPDDNGDGNGEPARRKRGRPAGSGKGTAKKQANQNLEKLLFAVHNTLAVISKTPELEISEDEAKQLKEGFDAVASLYDVPVVPPWVTAWGQLAMACGTVYGPRVIAIAKRKEDERVAKARPANKPDQPIPIISRPV